MNLFELYLRLGFKHIVDFNGYDHIVFMLVLCAGYGFSHFRKILVLVVAFIVAHCIALALSTLNIFTISIGLTNFLIPVTILIAAISNLFFVNKGRGQLAYFVTIFYGLIHGLGYSGFLKNNGGDGASILTSLLSFNLGMGLGLILVAAIHYLLLFIAITFFKLNNNNWRLFFSGAAFGIAIILIIENRIW